MESALPHRGSNPAMEEAEPPECPVCLLPYDFVSAIPRVLPCGHTTCEACLKQLPNPFPNTIRCTVCTVLVKFPNGPSSLPKNIDLLHFSSILQHQDKPFKDKKVTSSSPPEYEKNQSLLFPLIPDSWSYEFYRKWKRWILHRDSISIEEMGSENDGVVRGKAFKSIDVDDSSMACGLIEDEILGLVKVGMFTEDEENSKFLKCSYESRIVSVLYGINDKKLNELGFILNAIPRACNVGKVYGFWYNENDRCVYIVCQKFGPPNLTNCLQKSKGDEAKYLSSDEMRALAMLGTDMCEVIGSLHCQGLVIGHLGAFCFSFNNFGRVYVDLGEILNMGRRVDIAIQKRHKEWEESSKNGISDEISVFMSPEMFVQFFMKAGFDVDKEKLRYEVGCASDVCSLACLLVKLILGSSYPDETDALLDYVFSSEKGSGCSDSYMSWMEKIVDLLKNKLGMEYVPLQEILCKCLDSDPKNRPRITALWKCLRELVIKPQFDIPSLNQIGNKNSDQCLVLGELFPSVEESNKEYLNSLSSKDDNGATNGKLRVEGDVVEGVSKGRVKCVELKGHIVSVTGLAVGGGFLFSCSYDKIVNVWSLQDFSLVGSFKGHEHRVSAVVFVDGEQPLCLSGDNEGVICIWEVGFPFSDAPVKKMYEQKDWRYSGIHAMAISGTEYLYTGSGDTLVKAWSLKDYTLSCGMSGHKSVVSALEICNGVLYSGSWDGTVRLWSLSDHSSLAVLGEDKTGHVSSILSLSADNNLLVAGQENGCIKVWHNDIPLKSIETHKGAVFSVSKNGKWLFSGGWDKTINVQEISEDMDGIDVAPVGSIACNSTITALTYSDGKLFVGQADRVIKVYCGM